MKAKILEIAQVKNEQEFYRKYPTEESFMKVHGKAFKKAQLGANLPKKNYSLPGFPVVGNTSALPTFEEGVSNYMKQNSPATTYSDLWQRTSSSPNIDMNNVVQKGIPILGNVIRGFQLLADEKRQQEKVKQLEGVTDVNLKASQLQPQMAERKYIRPEDIVNTGEEFFPVYGKGEVFAKYGATIPRLGSGSAVPWDMVGNYGSNILTSIMGEDGGGSIGGALGSGIGQAVGGPLGGAIGQVGGQLIGSLIDTRPERIERYKDKINANIGTMAMGEGMRGLFNQNNKYMRTGGQLKNNEMYLRNGSVSPISNDIIEFNGNSHEGGGIDLMYGGNQVEVEGGETATKSKDGDLIVYGGMKAPGYNKSFKNVIKDIANKKNKASDTLQESKDQLASLDVTTPYDRIKYNSLLSNIKGSEMALKKYDEEVTHLASLQEAINQTADEMGINADRLSRGNIRVAKNGAIIKADRGATIGGRNQYIEYLLNASRKYGVNFNYMANLVEQESKYSPTAESGRGAKGIMQFIPSTAKMYGVDKILTSTNPKDVERVIDAGVKHFKSLLKDNNNDYDLAAAAYNGGQPAVNFVKRSLGKDEITGDDLISFYEQRRITSPTTDPNAWQNQTLDYVKIIREDIPQYELTTTEDDKNIIYNPKTGEAIPLRGNTYRKVREKWDVIGRGIDWAKGEIKEAYEEYVPEKAKENISKVGEALGEMYESTLGAFDSKDPDIQYGLPPVPMGIKGAGAVSKGVISKGAASKAAKNRAIAAKEAATDKKVAESIEAQIRDADELAGKKAPASSKKGVTDADIQKGILEDEMATATKPVKAASAGEKGAAKTKSVVPIAKGEEGKIGWKPFAATALAIGGLGGLMGLLNQGGGEGEEGTSGLPSPRLSGLAESALTGESSSSVSRDVSEYLKPITEEPLKLEPWMTDERNWQRSSKTSPSGKVGAGEKTKEEEKKGFDWNEAINTAAGLIPYLRPSDAESLDPRQLLGELSALQEKEEPVQAQLFHPQLTTPYRVSFQDQMNEITAQSRAAQRMAGSNPAAQAMIASQAYSAKSKVLADQFRVNQEMENRTYAENRNLMNQSILQNLSILDKQYERQSAAKSNTKAILRSALSSISDKYLKNQLENRTLATYENLYNYRFDPRFRAQNYNAPATFTMEGGLMGNPDVLNSDYEYLYDSSRRPVDIRKKPKESRNGAIVKAINDL